MKLFLSILYTLFITAVYSQPQFPILTEYATDLTNTLTQDELYNLGELLKQHEEQSGTQIAFLMVDSIGEIPLLRYTWQVANKSGLGRKDYNDGVLLFIAKSDELFKIEVAFRLEYTFSGAVQSSILRNKIKPYFYDKNYYQGIYNGLLAITQILDGNFRSVIKDKTIIGSQSNDIEALLNILFWIIFIAPLL